jgi:biopolymer transport protein ExbD
LKPDGSNFTSSSFDPNSDQGIRHVIMRKKASTPPDDLVIVIKPNEDASYKNTVDILDEMTISQVKRFALVDITANENQLVLATQQAGGVK